MELGIPLTHLLKRGELAACIRDSDGSKTSTGAMHPRGVVTVAL
jgi:hypothetical protein